MLKIPEPPRRKRICIADFGMSQLIWNGAWSFFRNTGRYRIDLYGDPRVATSPWADSMDYDGYICSASVEMLQRLRGKGRPIVCTLMAGEDSTPSVVLDEEAIGRLGAEHLLAQGYRRFAFFGVDEHWSVRRSNAFVAALQERGFACSVCAPEGAGKPPTWSRVTEEDVAASWLGGLEMPIAIMAGNDLLARMCANACVAAGIRVPQDVAILGVDNLDVYCEVDEPALSSVDAAVERVGYEAAAKLDRLLQGKDACANMLTVKPRGVTMRKSTSLLAHDDPEIAAAIRMIREHACEQIDVGQICRDLSISRRQFERNFARAVGHTPFEEIRRQRMEKARDLLANTTLSVLQIGLRCGYENASSFATMFRQCVGCTPHAYRTEHGI